MTSPLTDTTGKPSELLERFGVTTAISEDVEGAGLDPDIYVAVIEAELGVAGIVNGNGRIYQTAEFILENRELQARIEHGEFVDAELGHPPSGMFSDGGPTFNVPARLLAVSVGPVAGYGEGGPVQAVGKFGLLNTSDGRDVHALSRAGMPIGVSSRGQGVLDDYKIEEGGPYAAANPDSIGQSVGLVRDFRLERYDLVRVPSAGTYFKQGGPGGDATESLEVPTMATENAQADARPQPALTDFSELIAALRVGNPELAERVESLAQSGDALREQLAADQQRQTVTEARLQTLQEQIATLTADRDARNLRDRLDVSANEATTEKRFGQLVLEGLQRGIDSGTLLTPEAVSAEAVHLFSMIEAATQPVVAPVAAEPDDVSDDVVPVDESAAPDQGVDGLPQDLVANMRALSASRGA